MIKHCMTCWIVGIGALCLAAGAVQASDTKIRKPSGFDTEGDAPSDSVKKPRGRPPGAVLAVDGEPIKPGKSVVLKPGEYSVKLWCQGVSESRVTEQNYNAKPRVEATLITMHAEDGSCGFAWRMMPSRKAKTTLNQPLGSRVYRKEVPWEYPAD